MDWRGAWLRVWFGLLGFLGLAAFLLFREHRVHVVQGLIAVCFLSCLALYFVIPDPGRPRRGRRGQRGDHPSERGGR